MAYAFVGSGSAYNGSGANLTVTYSPTVGNTLLVCAAAQTAGGSLTPSDGSNTFNYIGTTVAENGLYESLWWVHVTTGGSLTTGFGVSGIFGLYIGEYSGLSATPYISSSFQTGAQIGPSLGANTITTSSNPNVTSVPAMLWGFSFNIQTLINVSADPGPQLGTTLAYNSRTIGWLGSGTTQAALAEDIRVTTTGTNPVTFGSTGNGQFDTFLTVAAAFTEFVSPIVQSASSPFSLSNPWSGGQVSVTLSGVTAGNAILVVTPAVINTTGSPTLTITDTVNSVTDLKQLASFGLSSVYSILDFSIIPNASAGAHTLTATVGSGTGYGFIVAAEISGLSSSAALDVFSLNSAGGGSNPSTGNSGTPASVNEIAIAAVSGYITGAVTIGEPSGYTNIAKYQAGGGYAQYSVDYLSPVALAAQLASWTGLTSVNSYVAGVIVLKAASNQATVMWWS